MSGQTDVVVGLDAGTTSAKAVAVDESGTILATGSSARIDVGSPSPGASVQSPAEIWQALGSACRKVTGPELRVLAISVAAQSGSVAPIADSEWGHAAELITWMDTRSQEFVDGWDIRTSDLIRSSSGWVPSPGLGLATIAWLHSTGQAVDTVRWASLDDYLLHRLCGVWETNPSNAAGMQLMDMATLDWSPRLCALAGVVPLELSTIGPSGGTVGALMPQAAADLSLPESTRVVMGGHDQACAALGLGAVEAGSTVLSMGTAWVLTIMTSNLDIAALPASFNLSPHVTADLWSASCNLGGLGATLAEALQGQAGGARLRTVMEACVFEVRRGIDEATAAGIETTELVVVGGGTRSEDLTQMLADVLRLDVTVRPEASWPASGAARLAASSLGWVMDPADVASGRVESRPEFTTMMEQRYLTYRSLEAGAST